jgi:hypothetical protein
MQNLARYKEWLVRARGIHNPSDEQVIRFKREVERHRLYGSILELLLAVWLDSRGHYRGTREYLAFQGLQEPSDEDLIYFHRRITKALIWRAAIGLLVVGGWFVFASYMRMWPFRG